VKNGVDGCVCVLERTWVWPPGNEVDEWFHFHPRHRHQYRRYSASDIFVDHHNLCISLLLSILYLVLLHVL
jgi:hypothetical protein